MTAQGVEQRGLARTGAPADDHVEAGVDGGRQQVGDAGRAELAQGHGGGAEATDGHGGAVDGQRGQHHVDPRPVGEASVDDGVRSVGSQAQWRHHPLDEQVDGGSIELEGRALEPARSFDPHRARAVDEDVVHSRVGEQRLQRPQAADSRPYPGHDPGHLIRPEQGGLLAHEVGQSRIVEGSVGRRHEHPAMHAGVELDDIGPPVTRHGAALAPTIGAGAPP
jgi:hypothetical protein